MPASSASRCVARKLLAPHCFCFVLPLPCILLEPSPHAACLRVSSLASHAPYLWPNADPPAARQQRPQRPFRVNLWVCLHRPTMSRVVLLTVLFSCLHAFYLWPSPAPRLAVRVAVATTRFRSPHTRSALTPASVSLFQSSQMRWYSSRQNKGNLPINWVRGSAGSRGRTARVNRFLLPTLNAFPRLRHRGGRHARLMAKLGGISLFFLLFCAFSGCSHRAAAVCVGCGALWQVPLHSVAWPALPDSCGGPHRLRPLAEGDRSERTESNGYYKR